MQLTIEKQIEELNELIHFNLDAIGAYTEAIDASRDPRIANPLSEFRGDHHRHVAELSAVVRGLGGKPATSADFKGMMRKTMTKIAGLMGDESILKAMKSNETAINKAYDHHFTLPFPAEVLQLIEKNREDEKRHLSWVEEALRARIWEHVPVHP